MSPVDWDDSTGRRQSMVGTRVYAVANFKGGVGKTTLALNLGGVWAEAGKRVLLVDLDPSGHLTDTLGLPIDPDDPDADTMYHVLRRGRRRSLSAVVQRVEFRGFGFDVAPANQELATLPFTVRDDPDWGRTLAKALWKDLAYDVVLIDCPPETRVFTYLALGAATDALVVLQPENQALTGAGQMLRHVEAMRELNRALVRQRMVINLADLRTGLARGIVDRLRQRFPDLLCTTMIPRQVRIGEAMVAKQPVVAFDPSGSAAQTMRRLADELLDDKAPGGER